eukprot:339046_1
MLFKTKAMKRSESTMNHTSQNLVKVPILKSKLSMDNVFNNFKCSNMQFMICILLCTLINVLLLELRFNADNMLNQTATNTSTNPSGNHLDYYFHIKPCKDTAFNFSVDKNTTQNEETEQWKHIKKSWQLRLQPRGLMIASLIQNFTHMNNELHKINKSKLTLNVADFGCGMMTLKNMLNDLIDSNIITFNYIPIDAFVRSNETILCDFNQHQFPFRILQNKMSLKTKHTNTINIAVCQGCLEYVYDKLLFLKLLRKLHIPVIITYFHYEENIFQKFVTQIKNENEMKYLLQHAQFEIVMIERVHGSGLGGYKAYTNLYFVR